VIPAPFAYERVEAVDHAIQLLTDDPDAKILAGGHSLLPLMRLRLARPSMLVDITRIPGLRGVAHDGDRITIGALTRHHDVATSEVLLDLCPILAHAAAEIGDPQVRHVGTIGGSVAHADPASDTASVLLALGAEMVVRGPDGAMRNVPAAGFFQGLFDPDLAANEVLTQIRVPNVTGRAWSYQKFHRRAQDWALVGVAVVGDGRSGVTVALTNMAGRPMRATGVEEALAQGADPAAAAQRAAEGTSPPSDAFATAEYRQELVKVIVRRALEEAMSRSP
jgi:aerobic carbon-monoxide dehydrogenase medium subunit